MKKLLGIITLAVMVLAVVPQVMAQDAAAIQKLTEDFMAGRITMPEFERRMAELTNPLIEQQRQAEQQERNQPRQQQQPQQEQDPYTRGMPPANILSEFGISGFPQSFLENPRYMRGPFDDEYHSSNLRGSRLVLFIRASSASVNDAGDWFTRNGWTVDWNNPHEKRFKKGNYTATIYYHDVGAAGLTVGIR